MDADLRAHGEFPDSRTSPLVQRVCGEPLKPPVYGSEGKRVDPPACHAGDSGFEPRRSRQRGKLHSFRVGNKVGCETGSAYILSADVAEWQTRLF